VIESGADLDINKADGGNQTAAEAGRAQYQRALEFTGPATAGWRTRALTASALTGAGIDAIWTLITEFVAQMKASGSFDDRRRKQRRAWLHNALEARLRDTLYGHEAIKAALPEIEAAVIAGELPAASAAEALLRLILPD